MNKQQLEEILNNAPEGMPQVHISEQFGVVYITVGGDDHNLSDLQTQLDQLNEIERLKSAEKRAFWWSAEFTHVAHDGKIQQAWEDYKELNK